MGRDQTPPAPREVELKLETDEAGLAALRAHPAFEGAAVKALHATYFDTPDRELRKAGISLRVRRSGDRRIQTVKAGGRAGAGLFDRDEWERDVTGDQPDLSGLDDGPVGDLLADVAGRIAPAFTVHVERTTAEVARGEAAAEVTLDEGVVEAGGREEPVAEVEIELRHGTVADLFAIARRLSEAAPLRLGIRTKADRGYALLAGKPPKGVKSPAPHVTPGMSAGEGFQAIARGCLAHLLRNEPALRLARDPDAVHQMRVAMRRLRAAISLHKPILADERRDAVAAEVKWAASELGDARDLDVFIARTLQPALKANPDEEDLAGFLQRLEGERARAYERALAALRSPRFRAMLLDLAEWVEAGPWLDGEDEARDGPVETFAAGLLGRRAKRLVKRGARLADMEPEPRHELRIAVKKLRYAVEFFTPAFEGRKAARRAKAYLGALERLQEHLGDLNDLAVGRARLAGEPHASRLDPLLFGRVDESRMLAEAVDAHDDLADARRFWT
ncbi:CYTH and CHAD domain-containing protein [Salinarimonas soli]|nr:CHAD domain-containing protein [Salinarimonas soli]